MWLCFCFAFDEHDGLFWCLESFVSTGSLILAALLDRESTHRDPLKLWFASLLLSLTLSENETTKSLAIKYTFSAELCPEFEGTSLMHYVVGLLIKLSKDSVDLRILAALYMLLIDWMLDSPASVSHFLAESSHLQYLMESMRQSSHSSAELTGLATFLYGCLILYQVDGVSTDPHPDTDGISSDYLKSILRSRLGYEVACSRLLRLRECAGWHASMQEVLMKWGRAKQTSRAAGAAGDDDNDAADAGTSLASDSDQPLIWFDPMGCTAMKARFDDILSVFSVPVSHGPAKKTLQLSLTDSLKSTVKDQETLIVSLKAQLSAALDNLSTSQSEAAAELARLRKEVATLTDKIETQQATIMNFESEQEDLLVCLAELDHENVTLKQALHDADIHVKESSVTLVREKGAVMESLELAERENKRRERETHQKQESVVSPSRSLSPREGPFSSNEMPKVESAPTAAPTTAPTTAKLSVSPPPPLSLSSSSSSRSTSMMKMVMDTFLPPSPGSISSLAPPKVTTNAPPMAILVQASMSSPPVSPQLASSQSCEKPDAQVACPSTSSHASTVSTSSMPPPSQVQPIVPPFMMMPRPLVPSPGRDKE